ncbi:MAG: GNAT family N-acetyltransferase [Marinovum sp.]|nr:GNAT family N-acetyltransferase [Marinovum sp.]
MMTDLHIRNAVPADIELIEDMIAALCTFHNDTFQRNPDAIIRDVFGPQAGARVFFGERQGTAVVFALCFNEFGLHIGQRRLRVHLFYIDEAHRKTGAGRQMMQYLERLAAIEGAGALVLGGDLQNEAAQQAYLSMGFKRREYFGANFIKLLEAE